MIAAAESEASASRNGSKADREVIITAENIKYWQQRVKAVGGSFGETILHPDADVLIIRGGKIMQYRHSTMRHVYPKPSPNGRGRVLRD